MLLFVVSAPAVLEIGAEERIVRREEEEESRFESAVCLSRTRRMEIVACRFWTRVTRPRTMESTEGRVLNFGFAVLLLVEVVGVVGFTDVCEGAFGDRDTVSIFLFGFDFDPGPDADADAVSSCVTTGPAMEAQTNLSRVYVPGPDVYVDAGPSRRPGTAIEGSVSNAIANSSVWRMCCFVPEKSRS